jgi:hypothetical protein
MIDTVFPHNFILGVSFQEDDIRIASENGLGHESQSRGSTADDAPEDKL